MLLPETKSELILVITTEADVAHADLLAKNILRKRLAACVSLKDIESHYWWNNRIESSKEVQLLIKTKASLLEELHKVVKQMHTYENPEFIFFKTSSESSYQNWMLDIVS